LGPRRIFAALAVLAIVVLTVTAGAAVASDLHAAGGGDHGVFGREHDSQELTSQATAAGGTTDASAGTQLDATQLDATQLDGAQLDATQLDATQLDGAQLDVLGNSIDVVIADSSSGSTSTSSDGTGGVTGSGAGTPSASGEAPAAAASGPAPDAAAAAPDPAPVVDAAVVSTLGAAVSDGFGAVGQDAAPVAPTNETEGVDDRPVLDATGSTGAIADQVIEAPAAARALVSTDRGRPLAAIGALLVAIVLFVGVHRGADSGDRKLAAARSGAEVARFR
jgi:hypothetical protein